MKTFIIMPFRPELEEVYRSAVIPACIALNIEPVRADEILDPGSIPEQIFQAIKDSLFVIAEISEQNDNVFYELGYAHALGKKTVLVSDRVRHLPFDVRVVRTIIYDRAAEDWLHHLRDSLESTIRHLFEFSERITVFGIKGGEELEGHMHTISGRVTRAPFPWHLWLFARRADLDTWWPQDDGEIRVASDGSWTAQLWLGCDGRAVDIDKRYELTFGLVNALDSRDLTELAVRSKFAKKSVGFRELPASFQELARFTVKRVRR
jgi:hypothetical protein